MIWLIHSEMKPKRFRLHVCAHRMRPPKKMLMRPTTAGGGPNPRTAENTVDNTVLSGCDWFPTVLAVANIPFPEHVGPIDGLDMSDAIFRTTGGGVTVPLAGTRARASGSSSSGSSGVAEAPRPLSTLAVGPQPRAAAGLTSNRTVTVRPPLPRPTSAGGNGGLIFWEWRFAIAGNCEHASPQLAVRDGKWRSLHPLQTKATAT
jgi:hypothetical protein